MDEDEQGTRAARAASMRIAVIGDSFAEGIGDGTLDGELGWGEQFAAMAAATGAPTSYANLAIRGRKIGQIADEQVRAALALDPTPTHVAVTGGGNDLLRPGFPLADVTRTMRRLLQQVLDAGATPVLLSAPDPSAGLPLGGLIHRRGRELALAYADLTAELDVPFVDVSHDVGIRRPEFWSVDRLHLNVIGHTRVARAVAAALLDEVPDAAAADAALPARVGSAQYYRDHVLPWVWRRVRGRSSGDGRSARKPQWETVPRPS